MHRAQLTDPAQVRAFLLAGNARLTIVSKRTGARFTFRVRQPSEDAPHFVQMLGGADNESDFRYLGVIFEGQTFKLSAKSPDPGSPSVKAFSWLWARLAEGRAFASHAEVWHEGRCGRCGRTLTVPESIETGLGPVCAGRAA